MVRAIGFEPDSYPGEGRNGAVGAPQRPGRRIHVTAELGTRVSGESAEAGLTPAGSAPAAAASQAEELQQERERHLRTRAEFENYRRRVERDREVAARQVKRELLIALVELADGFERALVHIEEAPGSVIAGVHGMQRRLGSLLEAEGVTSFESVGRSFDPTRHQAMATVADAGALPGTVVDEAGRGYLWHDELLRAAQVRVAE